MIRKLDYSLTEVKIKITGYFYVIFFIIFACLVQNLSGQIRKNDFDEKYDFNQVDLIDQSNIISKIDPIDIESNDKDSVFLAVWNDRGKFYDKYAHFRGIYYVKFSNNGEKIFTISQNDVKIWDTKTGNLLKNINLNSNDLFNVNISDDDSSMIASYQYDIGRNFDMALHIYDIAKDSLIYLLYLNLDHNPTVSCDYRFGLTNFQADYKKKENDLYFSYVYNLLVYCGGIRNDDKGRYINIPNLDTSKSIIIFNNPVKQFYISPSGQHYLLSNSYSSYYETGPNPTRFDIQAKSSIIRYNNNLKDYFFFYTYNYYYTDNHKNEPKFVNLRRMLFCENKEFFTGYLSTDNLIKWNMNNYSVIDSIDLFDDISDLKISNDGKFIILGRNSGIHLYDISTLRLIDSIQFKYETGYNWKIAVSPDSNTYAIGTYDGRLILWKPDISTGINNDLNVLNNKILLIYPNPAVDYLEFEFAGKIENQFEIYVEVYNSLGKCIYKDLMSTFGKQRIDISSFPSGVYYLRRGNIGKMFIKE